jgi:MYXO-CTERM domain-containing protein
MKLFPLAIAAAFAIPSLATATVVNIDFATATSGGYTGFGAAENVAGNTTWNTASYAAGSGGSITMSDLVDSTSAGTSVDFNLTGIQGSQNPSGQMERSGGYSGMMRDYVRVDGLTAGLVATANGSFSNLVVGASYDLYFYGQGENFNAGASLLRGQNTLFTVNGISKQTSWDGTALGDGLLVEGIEYVKFTVVAVNNGFGDGVINFSFSNVVATGSTPNVATDFAPNQNIAPANTASRYGALNGVQLVSVVPEASSALLGILGMGGLLLRRRRD